MKKRLFSLLSLSIALAMTAVAPSAEAARSSAQSAMFKRHNPCPSTGSTKGTCVGYVINHKRALCLGGADRPFNMEWQEKRASYVSDGEERRACYARKKALAAKRAERAAAKNL